MAKLKAPFKIQGTLDDLNFMIYPHGSNYVRMKGKTGITSKEFKSNPMFDRIRNQGKEMGYCAKKARTLQLQIATAYWDITNDSFQTYYSDPIILDKEAKKGTIRLTTNSIPEANKLKMTFLFVVFLVLERRKHKELHRKHNTATIIACQKT